jgi:hypothetical protein
MSEHTGRRRTIDFESTPLISVYQAASSSWETRRHRDSRAVFVAIGVAEIRLL